jgi:hypothetical protein
MKLYIISFSFLLIFNLPNVLATGSGEVKRVKDEIGRLKEEVAQLKLSVRSLDSYQEKMEGELSDYEEGFQRRFRQVVIPLLNWPAVSSTTRVKSWTEHQHLKMVISSLQERLIKEPLEMISDRELRLSRANDLRLELKETLKELELKEAFLALELEEMRMLRKKSKKGK